MSDTKQKPTQQQPGQSAPTGPTTPAPRASGLKYGSKKIKVLHFLNVALADKAGGGKAGKAAAKAMKLADAAAGEKWKAERPGLDKYVAALTDVGAAATELKNVRDALTKADAIATSGAFVEARAFVKAQNFPAIVEQGLAKAKARSAAFLQKGGKFKDAHDALAKLLAGSEPFLPPAELADFSGKLAAIVDQVGGKKIDSTAGVTQVGRLQTRVQAAFATARGAKAQVDERHDPITTTLKTLEAALPPALYAPYAEQWAVVETWVDEKEFVRAETALTALEAQVSQIAPASLKQRWDSEYPAYSTKVQTLDNLTGAEAQFAVAIKALASAKAAADNGGYAEARHIIAAADLDQLQADGYAAHSAGEREAEDGYPYLWDKVRGLRGDLNAALNVDGLLTQDAWTDLDAQLDAAIKPLFKKNPKGVDDALDAVRKALEDTTRDTEQYKYPLKKELAAFDAKQQKMMNEDRLLNADSAIIAKERKDIGALAGNAKYQDALTKLRKLSADLDAAGKEAAAVAGYRDTAKPLLDRLLAGVTGMKQISVGYPALQAGTPNVNSVQTAVTALGALDLTKARLADLITFKAEAQKCVAELRELLKRKKAGDDPEFVKARDAAKAAVGAAEGRVSASLKTFDPIVQKATPKLSTNVKPLAPAEYKTSEDFRDRLATIMASWTAEWAEITDRADFDPKPTVALLDTLRTEIDTAAQNPQALKDAMLKEVRANALAQFETAAAKARKAIDRLAQLDVLQADQIERELDELMGKARNATNSPAILRAQEKLPEIVKKASSAERQAASQVTTSEQTIEAALAAAEKAWASFAAEVEKRKTVVHGPADVKGKSQEKYYGPMRDAFRQRLDEATAMASTKSFGVLQQVEKQATALLADILHAHNAVRTQKGKADGKSEFTMADYMDCIAETKTMLTKGKVPKYCANSAAEYLQKIGDLERKILTMSMAEGREAFCDLGPGLQALVKKATDAETAFETLQADIKTASAELDGKELDDAKALKAQLRAELEACEVSGRKEGQGAAAKTQVADISRRIGEFKADPAKKAAANGATEKANEAAELEDARWQGRVEHIRKRANAFPKKAKEEIDDLIDSADRIYKKAKDVKIAGAQLVAAEKRADYYEEHPRGVALSKSGDLVKVAQEWTAAARDLRTALAGVCKTIDNLPDADINPNATVAKAVKAQVTREVDNVTALLGLKAFDKIAQALSNPGLDAVSRLPMRETGLRTVAKLLAVLETDPRLRALELNPFQSVHASLVAARLAVINMQQTLIGCV